MDRRFEGRLKEMLAQAEVDPQWIEGFLSRLEAFVQPFSASLAESAQKRHTQEYLIGLLSRLEHKTGEGIAYLLDQDRQGLQIFIGQTSWDDVPLRRTLAALANLLQGRTAFIIAHRLATVVNCDLIVVMDGGLIVQRGTHDELLADENGLYRQLCLRQFGEPHLAKAGRRTSATGVPAPHLGAIPAPRRRSTA